ncbi:MAG: prokaryotic dksA/traR C4-type zinc finger family protein [Actinoallomurus sp.]|jgi:RNA polymerase-binding protein DksA|nr:prokaryotic dksA/traR C4-type zinc finger family protein [Actinoallomurus sp.]
MDGTAGPKDRNPTAEAPGATRAGTRRAPAVAQKISAATAKRLPVREGEGRWTPGELTDVRGRLEVEMIDLRTEIATAESQIAERMSDAAEGAGDDQADAGAKTFEREQEMALTYNARDLLAQNERAIDRIEQGTYGVCESCGQPIGKARLQAFPRATLCVTCKQREERR